MTACEKAIRYLLAKMDEESGDVMTLPVLQKLLYYSQGFSLAITGKPLFEEDFEVWQMGPVIPALFEKYGKEPGFGILNPSETRDPGLTAEEKDVLDQVYFVYGQFSGWKLRDLVLADPLIAGAPIRSVIPKAAMRDAFLTRLEVSGAYEADF